MIALVLLLSLVFASLIPVLAEKKDTGDAASRVLEETLSKLGKKTLACGDKGSLVKTIKTRMKELSYYSEDAVLSSDFNADMEEKVKQLQKKNNIKVTGKINADFLKLIYSDHCVTATGIVLTEENNYLASENYTLLGNEQFCAGEDGNIIVIILDTYSNAHLNALLKKNPDAQKGLEDFTYYNNYDCCFVVTYPSVVMMLTGYEYDNTVTIGQWFSNAWKSKRAKSFFKTMKKKGYESYLYSVGSVNLGLKSDALGLFKNLVRNSEYSGEVIKQKVSQNFYTAVQENGVTTRPGKRFIIQHLYGLHTPYNVDENGNPKTESTQAEAASGWLTIAKAYLEALKKAGVYDNSTIIIMADHGPKVIEKFQPIFLIKLAGETHKKMQKTNAPVSHREFQSTILHCAGVSKKELPSKTIFDYEEDEERERTVYINKKVAKYGLKPRYNGTGWGVHNVWAGYTYTGDIQDLVKEAKRHGPSKYIEMNCSFN